MGPLIPLFENKTTSMLVTIFLEIFYNNVQDMIDLHLYLYAQMEGSTSVMSSTY
jgi:hypothetical protein